MQFVLAREKESVAARKMEMSIVCSGAAGLEELAESVEVLEGISLGSEVEVIGAGSSGIPSPFGEGGGVGGELGSCGDVFGAEPLSGIECL